MFNTLRQLYNRVQITRSHRVGVEGLANVFITHSGGLRRSVSTPDGGDDMSQVRRNKFRRHPRNLVKRSTLRQSDQVHAKLRFQLSFLLGILPRLHIHHLSHHHRRRLSRRCAFRIEPLEKM